MSRMASGANKGVVLGILALGGALAGLSWYIHRLATSPAGNASEGGHMPSESLESVLESVSRLIADDRWSAAEAICAKAVEQYPADRDLRLRYAEVLQGLRRFADAHAQYVEALSIGPREASIEYLAGLCANSAGLGEQAMTHLAFALASDKGNATYALELGLVQFNNELFDESRASLTIARTLDPNLAMAWGMLAQIALRGGDHAIARTYVAKARELDPASLDWRVVEARAVVRDEPARAAELLEGLPPEAMRRVDVRHVLRSALGSMGEFARAAELFAQASDAQPTDVDLALETADLYERAGNRERAIEYARRGAIIGGEDARGMLTRLEQQGG